MLSQSRRLGDTGSTTGSSNVSWVGQFIQLNPLSFTGSKVDKDPQEFFDVMEKIFKFMHASNTGGGFCSLLAENSSLSMAC